MTETLVGADSDHGVDLDVAHFGLCVFFMVDESKLDAYDVVVGHAHSNAPGEPVLEHHGRLEESGSFTNRHIIYCIIIIIYGYLSFNQKCNIIINWLALGQGGLLSKDELYRTGNVCSVQTAFNSYHYHL